MKIGIDLDNTIIIYDQIFSARAIELGYFPDNRILSKSYIRDELRKLPDGDLLWQELQAFAYGSGIKFAKIAANFSDFVESARRKQHELVILSHKTVVSPVDKSSINLREAAITWMSENNFFIPLANGGLGFSKEDVNFFDTREDKVAAIISCRCDVMIDDLIEVFKEPNFPQYVKQILYSPNNMNLSEITSPVGFSCSDWKDIKLALVA